MQAEVGRHTTLVVASGPPTGSSGACPTLGLRGRPCLPCLQQSLAGDHTQKSVTLGKAALCLHLVLEVPWFLQSLSSLVHFVQNFHKFLELRIDMKVQRNPLIYGGAGRGDGVIKTGFLSQHS